MKPLWIKRNFFYNIYHSDIGPVLREYLSHFLSIELVKCYQFDTWGGMVDSFSENGFDVLNGGYVEAEFCLHNILSWDRTECVGYAINKENFFMAFVDAKIVLRDNK
jgi:hypothetical protein